MSGNGNNKYNAGNYNSSTSRVERLVRGRELRKSSKASASPSPLIESPDSVLINNNNINNSNDNNNSNHNCNNNKHVVTESFEHDICLKEYNNPGASHVERLLEGAAKALGDGYVREDGKPIRQRLLVVANRLPVSAVRKGEDSWSLEISAGGLVSALLGMC